MSHGVLLQEASVHKCLWRDTTHTPPADDKLKAQHQKGGQWCHLLIFLLPPPSFSLLSPPPWPSSLLLPTLLLPPSLSPSPPPPSPLSNMNT